MHQSIKFTFIKCPSFKDLRMQEAINIKIKLLSLIWLEKFSLGIPRFFYWHFLQLELSRICLSYVFHPATWSCGFCANLRADRSKGLVALARTKLCTCFCSKVVLFSPTVSWEWPQGVKLLASLCVEIRRQSLEKKPNVLFVMTVICSQFSKSRTHN